MNNELIMVVKNYMNEIIPNLPEIDIEVKEVNDDEDLYYLPSEHFYGVYDDDESTADISYIKITLYRDYSDTYVERERKELFNEFKHLIHIDCKTFSMLLNLLFEYGHINLLAYTLDNTTYNYSQIDSFMDRCNLISKEFIIDNNKKRMGHVMKTRAFNEINMVNLHANWFMMRHLPAIVNRIKNFYM